MARPTKDDISQRLLELRTTAEELHAKWKEIDTFIHGTYSLWDSAHWQKAANWPEYHPSTPWSVYARARDRMTTAVPVARRRVLGDPAQRGKLVADKKIEPWANYGLRHMMSISPAAKRAWGNAMRYGLFVMQGPVLDPMWRDYDSKAKTYWPARFHAPHPATVLLDPLGPTVPRDVFQFSVISAAELRAMTADRKSNREDVAEEWENDDTRNPFITIGERWTQEWHALFVYGENDATQRANVDAMQGGVGRLIFIEPNNWGFVPFVQSPTFWGAVKADATLKDAWAQECEGSIDHMLGTFRAYAQVQTAKRHAVIRTAMAGIRTSRDPGQVEQAMRESDVVQLNEGDVGLLPSPDVKPALFEVGNEFRAEIEEGTHTKQLGGFSSNVDTLGQTLVNIAEANKLFSFPQERLQVCMGAGMSNLLRFQEAMIAEYDKPMRIMGLELTKSDIGGDYNMEVEFRVVDVVLKLQNEEAVVKKVQAGLIDKETARTEMGYENIAELEERSLKEQVQASPEVMAEAMAAMAKQLGYLKAGAMFEQEAQEMRQQREQAAPGPSRGGNGGGGGMELPSETPTSPVRDLGPAGQLRRNETGAERVTSPPMGG